MLGRGFVRRAGVDIDIQKHVMLTFGTKTRINIYVDVCFGAPKACEDVILTAEGPKMRINIYADARFGAPQASEDMILTSFGAQSAHQHLC